MPAPSTFGSEPATDPHADSREAWQPGVTPRDAHAAGADGSVIPPNPLPELGARLAELLEYGQYYLQARLDIVKLGVWKVVVAAAVGAIGLLVAGAFAVTCIVLLLDGCARGLSILFGDRYWLGYLVAGAAGLVLLGIVGGLTLRSLRESRRRAGERKYDERRRAQRIKFGRDVEQAAIGDGVPPAAG